MGPIGVFDSGLGGLTVLRALNERLPAEDLVYFGDTARVPYGGKGGRTVRIFARQDAEFLCSLGVKMVVVACNTASAFALDYLQDVIPVPVLGVIRPGVETALRSTRGGAVGVIATRGTITSGRYQAALAAVIGEDRVLARETPLLVPLAEEGMIDHPVTEQVVEGYVAPLREAGIDTLILGCTHYPLLKGVLGRAVGPEVTLVDSAEALAEATAAKLAAAEMLRPGDGPAGRLSFWLSDLPWKFKEIGERFLGRTISSVETVNLDERENGPRPAAG